MNFLNFGGNFQAASCTVAAGTVAVVLEASSTSTRTSTTRRKRPSTKTRSPKSQIWCRWKGSVDVRPSVSRAAPNRARPTTKAPTRPTRATTAKNPPTIPPSASMTSKTLSKPKRSSSFRHWKNGFVACALLTNSF